MAYLMVQMRRMSEHGGVLLIHPVKVGEEFRGSIWHNCGIPLTWHFYGDGVAVRRR